MVDLSTLMVGIWLGCFVVVSFDSAFRRLSPVFWRFASFVGGPFALAAYGIARQMASKKD
ncbi:MAG: hypothetical protein C4555_01495 [Dehalococcoidia bacterium]|jgi:hypothetical protein|nr:MAG: hypothetical protein C4555_01495 [Dehalococcoidia bacterium]